MRSVVWGVIALYLGLLAWVAMAASWPALHQFWTSDDAFFYLQIARNVARGAGSTFDGIGLTNGYHPLWLAAVSALFKLTGSLAPETGVRAVFALGAVCAVAGTLTLSHLVARLAAPPLVAVVAVLGLLSSYGFWYFGLEAHLNVVMAGVVFSLVWQRWRDAAAREQYSLAGALTLAVAAALLVLTRIDLVVWVAVLLLSVSASRSLAGWPRPLVRRMALVEQGVSAGLVVAYVAMNRVVFGALLPISAALRTKSPSLSLQSLSFYHAIDTVHLLVLVGVSALMLAVAWRAASQHGRGAVAGTRLGFGAALAAGTLVHTAVAVLCSVGVEPRYLVTSTCAVVVIVAILLSEAMAVKAARAVVTAVAGAGALALTIALGLIAWHRVQPQVLPADLAEVVQFRSEIAPLLNRNSVVFAVDFSGELAWFCDCHLINGDGLVNDWNYQKVVAERRVTDYLDAHRVEYVIETSGELRGDMVWVDGYDWRAFGEEAFPIVGFPASAALAHVGPFRLFRYSAR